MVGGEAREAQLTRGTERLIGWFRIIGGVVGIVLTVTDQVVHPDLEHDLEVASLALLALVGVATLVWLRRDPDGAELRRWMRWTYAIDAAVLLAQVPLHSFVVLEAPSPAILVPLLGAVRFGYRGAVGGLVGVVGAYVVRGVLAVQVYDLGPGVDPAAVTVLLAGIVGLMTAHFYETAHAGRRAADAATAEAESAQEAAERASARVAATHAVLAGGVGGSVAGVGQRLAETVREVTGARAVHLHLEVGGASRRIEVGAGADPGEGAVRLPVRHGEVDLGTLEVVEPARLEDDLEEFAQQVGLAVHAARLLDEEAALAARHRALDIMRTDFVALTSHELRTPVAAIIGAADTLRANADAIDDDFRRELYELLHRQGERLHSLVEDLLTVGRTEAGTVDYRPKYIQVGDMVADVLHELGRTAAVRPGPAQTVWLDPERGHQVLLNIVDNAFEHGEPPVTISWRVVDDHAEVRVVDGGNGVPADLHTTMFERFVQLGSVMNHTRGTGLGLGISRDLVRAMGGDVRIAADAPTTTFVIDLPLEPAAASAPSEVSD